MVAIARTASARPGVVTIASRSSIAAQSASVQPASCATESLSASRVRPNPNQLDLSLTNFGTSCSIVQFARLQRVESILPGLRQSGVHRPARHLVGQFGP